MREQEQAGVLVEEQAQAEGLVEGQEPVPADGWMLL